MTLDEVKQVFFNEFSSVKGKFQIVDLPVKEANKAHDLADRPGVYVYWKDNQVIKVGRHMTNARTRSLEHIRDNTGNEMALLKDDPDCRILFFTVGKDDYHWIATPEIFLEVKLDPKIKSGRLG